MKKPQWITAGIALLLITGLFALTQDGIFGYHPKKIEAANPFPSAIITIDSILHHAKQNLSSEQLTKLNFLENSITRGDVEGQKVHVLHQLSRYWRDSIRLFEPFAWYNGEAARLESSEKSLTFAAQLFLNNLKTEGNLALKTWKALQAKDLFERSLKLNPTNDSAQIGLGATYLYSSVANNPMEGILKIRQVVEKDSTNVYALMTLGEASILSGQSDKAIERFAKVVQLQPANLEAILSLADIYERDGNKEEAIKWYQRSLSLINIPGLRKEVEIRIKDLNK